MPARKRHKTEAECEAAKKISAKRYRESKKGRLANKRWRDSEQNKVTLKQYHCEWYAKYGKSRARNRDLKRFYGITIDGYNQIFIKQNGCCAICGKHQSELKNTLAVDHDHKTGEIRGLLCMKCNMGLGNFNDSENLMKKAIDYLT